MNLKNKSVLIVEDEPSNYYLLQTILERSGIITTWVTNGIDAVNTLNGTKIFDAIFMDLKIPKLNGYEATRRIKRHYKSLPIIAVTAYALTGDKEKAIAAGCDKYITKPYKKNDILNILSEALLEQTNKQTNMLVKNVS